MNVPAREDPPPAYDFTEDDRHSMEDEARSLPKGWVRDYDPTNKHHFYVDTQSNPLRSIWVHPFEDEQFRREHPDLFKSPSDAPPAATSGASSPAAGPSTATAEENHPEKKGFFQKLKDKSAEHAARREEERRRREALQREAIQRYTMRRQEMLQQRQAPQQPQYGQGPLYGAPGGYGQGRYPPPGMAYGGRRRGGGMALPLMGGLAGGLLLGEMFDDDGFGGGFGDMGGGFGDMGGGF